MHVPHACINYIYFRGRRGVMCMCTLLRAAHSMGPAARGVSLHGVSCTMGCPWGVHGVSMGCPWGAICIPMIPCGVCLTSAWLQPGPMPCCAPPRCIPASHSGRSHRCRTPRMQAAMDRIIDNKRTPSCTKRNK